jgi:DnaJ-class molecular chaperone
MKLLIVLLASAVALAAVGLLFVHMDCRLCAGSGHTSAPHKIHETCPHCGGRGIDRSAPKPPPRDGVRRMGDARPKCLYCRGTGKVERTVQNGPCPACAGTGTQPLFRWLLDRFS